MTVRRLVEDELLTFPGFNNGLLCGVDVVQSLGFVDLRFLITPLDIFKRFVSIDDQTCWGGINMDR